MNMHSGSTIKRRIHTVSQLTAIIKDVLEDALPFVWVSGEISNLRQPASGHYYLTLKDDQAQIRAVMFKGHARNLKFAPEDGMSVVCLGRVAVYEPQGAYQILIEHMDPAGMGALAQAFEQLKTRLSEEGLFDEDRKKPLPFLPQKAAVITSPTGAVIHDILRVILRRNPHVHVQVWPVRVQGAEAPANIVDALALANEHSGADVIILARGGGSLEDLAAFNSEDVARAIAASRIPVVSAVGHETDYTIADFTADLRAPTPSAAAEMIMPEHGGLAHWLLESTLRLRRSMESRTATERERLEALGRRVPSPRRQVDDWRLRLDDHRERSAAHFTWLIRQKRERLSVLGYKVNNLTPLKIISSHKPLLEMNSLRLARAMAQTLSQHRAALEQFRVRLEAGNPQGVLDKGYSITRTLPGMEIVRNAAQAAPGQDVEVSLAFGKLVCVVKDVKEGEGS